MTAAADQIRNRRQAIAAPGAAIDKVVRVLAVVLPMAVGVLAAFMLVTPLSPRGEVSFLLDRNTVAVAADRLRVDDAMYRGQDRLGRPFTLSAGEAVQHVRAEPVVTMHDLTARIMLPDGAAQLSAADGTYAIDQEQVGVPGVLQFTAADGYRLGVRNVTIDLPGQTLVGRGQVSGIIPAGNFSADRIEADLAARRLVLSGNAAFTMIPGQLRLPSAMR